MKLVILDRDGVINRDSADYIKSPEEWVPLPGSLDAIARLTQKGWRVVVATNQSGVGRGLFDEPTLAAIHRQMEREVTARGGRIDAVFYCPHGPRAGCDCRKPAPGLFHQIARRLQMPLDGVPVIGDAERDIEAASAAGARPMLVRTGKGRETERHLGPGRDVPVFDDLAEAAGFLISESTRS